jgi:signal transduction histidine kinase/ABC-type amino acid transport substrate-binding protein
VELILIQRRFVIVVVFLITTLDGIARQDTLEIRSHTDTIHISISAEPDYPPFSFVDARGNPAGLSIDLFKAAAQAVNIEYDINIGVWDLIMKDLAEGRIDALPFVGRTPEREPYLDFTMPYLSLHGDIFVRKRSNDIESLADLKDKKVAVMRGDNAEEFVRRDSVSKFIFTTNTYKEAYTSLSRGEYDAVITQRITGLRLINELGLKNVEPLNIYMPGFRQDFCFAVTEGNDTLRRRLNEGLSVIIASGTYDEIHKKWLGDVTGKRVDGWEVFRKSLAYTIPLLILILFIAVLVLRRRVAVRTSNLQHEMENHRITAENLRKQNMMLNEMEKISLTGGWEYDLVEDNFNWTDGVYRIYGVSREDFQTSNYLKNKSFYHPDDQAVLDKAFKRLIEEGIPYALELRFRSEDQVDKWVRTSGHLELKDGNIIRVYGNIMDVSRQKEIELELLQLKANLESEVSQRTGELEEKMKKLDRSEKALLYMVEDLNDLTGQLKDESRKLLASNKELEAFSYSVSHDLRAPLRAINGFSSFLIDDFKEVLGAEGNRMLSVIRQNAEKMDDLITKLLALSRLSRSAVNALELDMESLIRSVFEDYATDEQKADFTIEINEMPMARCDHTLFRQVWENLIGNALKYSARSEQKKLEFGGSNSGDEVVFYIRDHGAGFDPAYVDKIFGMFQRLHHENEFEGTGVGLAIVQRIIHRHGGRIWAEGFPGKGAAFYFSLPK